MDQNMSYNVDNKITTFWSKIYIISIETMLIQMCAILILEKTDKERIDKKNKLMITVIEKSHLTIDPS